MKLCTLIISVLFFVSNASADLSKDEFINLSIKEQNRLLLQSYLAVNYLLAITGINDKNAKSGPREMFSCMKERDIPWLRKTYSEYAQKYSEMATQFSQNLSQSIAWKCGLLSFSEEKQVCLLGLIRQSNLPV